MEGNTYMPHNGESLQVEQSKADGGCFPESDGLPQGARQRANGLHEINKMK